MLAAIHQPQYLPWLGYFNKICQSDVFILLDNVQFKKNEWQNRNRIRTPDGCQWLTVPVIHDFGQKINQVKINNQIKWGEAHLKALALNYKKSKYFSEYFAHFEEILTRPWEYLADVNTAFILKCVDLLGIQPKIVKASAYETTDDSTQRLIDLCRLFNAEEYLSGQDGSKYMDLTKFEQNHIQVRTQSVTHPVYPQVWGKGDPAQFVSHLSIVDLLFNVGRDESLRLIKEMGGRT